MQYPIHHIVLFKYKESTNDDQKVAAANRFRGLQQSCLSKEGKPYIGSVTSGSQNNSERRSKGFEHGFTVLFANEAERDYYLFEDPVHLDFKKYIAELIEDALTFDYTEGEHKQAIVFLSCDLRTTSELLTAPTKIPQALNVDDFPRMAYYDVLTSGHPVPRLNIPVHRNTNPADEAQTSPERSSLNRAFRGLKRSSDKSHKKETSGSSISSTTSGQGGPPPVLGLGLQSDMPTQEASPIDKGVSLLATLDGEQLCRVDISGASDARIVKELMYTRLHIMDEDHGHCTVHRGHFNQVNEGPALTESELWEICQSASSQPSPPILLVRIGGPIKGYAAPLLSPNNTAPSPLLPNRSKENSPRPESSSSLSEELVGGFFLSENRVASPREPTEELRSAHPQWHKARTSDPSSQATSRRSQLSPISGRPPISPERPTDRNSSGSGTRGRSNPQMLTEQRRTSAGSDEWWEAEQRNKRRQEEAVQRQRDIEWQRQLEIDVQRKQRTRRISLEDVPEKDRYRQEMGGHPRARSHAEGRPASEQAVGFGPSGPYYSAATVPGRSQPSIAFQPPANPNRNFSQPMAAGFGPSGPTRLPRQQPPQMPRQQPPAFRQSNNPFTQLPDSLAAPRRPLNNAKSMDDLRGGRRNIPPPPDFAGQPPYPAPSKQRKVPPPHFPSPRPFAEQHSSSMNALPAPTGLPSGQAMSGIQQWRDQTAREFNSTGRTVAPMMRPNNSSQGPSRQQRIVSPEQLRPNTAPISQTDRFGGPPLEEHHRWRMSAAPPIAPPSAQINLGQRLKLQPGGVLSTSPIPTAVDMRLSSSQDSSVKPRNQFMSARDPSLGGAREAHARNEIEGSGVVPVVEERVRQKASASRPHTSSGSRDATTTAQTRPDPMLARSAPSGRRTPGDESNEEDAYGGMDDSSSSSRNRSSTPRSHPSTAPSTPVESPPVTESAPPQRRSLLPSPTAPVLWENDFLDPTNPDEGTLVPRLPQVSAITSSDEWDDMVSRIRTSQPNDEGTLKGPTAVPSMPADDLQIDKPACPTLDNHFASFSDDDDDDADGDTWAKPLDPVNTLPKSEPLTPTRTTPRPTLRIKTGSEANSPVTPSRSGSSTSAEPSKPFDSDREDKWAVRPSVEHVYEDLERFFPDHDLDKPIVDAASTSPATSPQNTQEDITETDAAPLLPAKLRPKKSIRVVAQDRKKFLQRAVSTQQHTKSSSLSSLAAGLLRRKSTKLWGSRLEEVTPSKGKRSLPPPLAKEDTSDPQTASIKWVKGELIGKGSYGKVYLALNVNSGEMLAVKQVEMPQTTSDKDNELQSSVVAALHFEIETLKDLDHPNIVQFLGQEQTPQYLSIFLEYVPGGSVGRCIRKHGKFEKEVVQYFTVQILSGLSYLHGKGVLHRDLKADNILVDLEGNCKISDFGISKRSDDIYSDKPEMSMQGSVFWMAPEVIHNGKRGYSAKVDIWSLGCVALEMIGGKRPWNDEQLFQALYKLGAEKSAPPIPEDANLCEEGRDFLEHCFTVDPASRPTAEMLLCHPYMVRDLKWRFAQSSLGQALVKHRKSGKKRS